MNMLVQYFMQWGPSVGSTLILGFMIYTLRRDMTQELKDVRHEMKQGFTEIRNEMNIGFMKHDHRFDKNDMVMASHEKRINQLEADQTGS